MGSLFNVAVENENLRPAAGIVYKQKLDEKSVVITKKEDPHSEPLVHGNQVNIINISISTVLIVWLAFDS